MAEQVASRRIVTPSEISPVPHWRGTQVRELTPWYGRLARDERRPDVNSTAVAEVIHTRFGRGHLGSGHCSESCARIDLDDRRGATYGPWVLEFGELSKAREREVLADIRLPQAQVLSEA